MKINNILELNDWENMKFLKMIFSIQIVMWTAIWMDINIIEIPIFRIFISFIYLLFIPGIIILRILGLHKLGIIENTLFSIGLSIATLMFIGLFANSFLPSVGISKPISLEPLMLIYGILILGLSILCHIQSKSISFPTFIYFDKILSPQILFLLLIPLISIIGTYFVNFHKTNIILIYIILLISLIFILFEFNIFFQKEQYPFAILAISISLLFQYSLLSTHIWGFDIHIEYYLSNLVIKAAHWNPTIPVIVNSMLSIVMIAPIFSIFSGMNLTWIFKIIYPLLFSLVPIGLYKIYQKQMTEKIAFFSVFFFISIYTFFTEMLTLARQEIAEIFLILLILLMLDQNIKGIKKNILYIIFAFSLGLSHYGLSYIIMFSLCFVFLKFKFTEYYSHRPIKYLMSTKNFILLYIVFIFGWYIYISGSVTFNAFTNIGNHISESIFENFLDPKFSEGLEILNTKSISNLHEITKYFHIVFQFLISVGILTIVFKRETTKINIEFFAFAEFYYIILLVSISVPFFASSLNTTRIYHISLIFLAPFLMIGWITICNIITKLLFLEKYNNIYKLFAIFLAWFFLINTGLVYEVAKDNPTSFSLNNSIDMPLFNEKEYEGANWIIEKRKYENEVFSDGYRSLIFYSFLGDRNMLYGDKGQVITFIPGDFYFYLGHENIHNNKIVLSINRTYETIELNTLKFYNTLLNMNNVYSNGDVDIYSSIKQKYLNDTVNI